MIAEGVKVDASSPVSDMQPEDQISISFREYLLLKATQALFRPASRGINTLATNIAQATAESVEKGHSISSASKELRSGLGSITQFLEQINQQSQTIASGSEEMSATIREIALSVEGIREMTSSSTDHALQLTKQAESLVDNTDAIKKIVKTINGIADQIKILSLNATIEAVKAGEAGRGFSVVANEVKELAGATASSIASIQETVDTMIATVESTEAQVGSISSQIEEINERVITISAAIEEQSVTTDEIAGTIASVSDQIVEVNRDVLDCSEASSMIARDMEGISDANLETAHSINGLEGYSEGLSEATVELTEAIDGIAHCESAFDIGQIKDAHLKWGMKLKSFLNDREQLTVEDIPDDTQCDLGKWCRAVHAKMNHSETFRDLLHVHKAIHLAIVDIVREKSRSTVEEIEKKMVGFHELRTRLFHNLNALYMDFSTRV